MKSYRQQFCLPDQGRRHVLAHKLHKGYSHQERITATCRTGTTFYPV